MHLKILPSVFVLCLFGSVSDAFAGNSIDSLLSKNPVGEAEASYARGDKRHIIIPVCGNEPGEVIPGWPIENTPEIQAAMEQGRRPVTCEDFELAIRSGPEPITNECDDSTDLFMRLVEYSAAYNARLLELEAASKK